MTITMYAIPNCDTVKKARVWLDTQGVSYDFHDYKKLGVTEELLGGWIDAHGVDVVLNKAGTTFKKLSSEEKADLDRGKAIALMLAQPSMIKRPILALGDRTLVGFKPDQYQAAFK